MNLENASPKQVNDMEQMTTHLLKTMRRSKLHTLPLYVSLQDFERQLGDERCNNYDKKNSDYRGY